MTEGKRSQTKLTTVTTKNVTIEQLAERFNQTVWVKGDLKRIYLNDEGYNTKKMSTKTFIFEKDGEFIVSCRIECPSQPYQWIQSQEEEVKEGVYSKIEDYIERIIDPSIDAKEAEEEARAEAEWEAGREEREKKAAELAKEKEEQKKIAAERTAAVFEGGGEKYSHSKFGESRMIKSVRIKFEKFLHDTGKAILVRINGVEHWVPKKLCRNLIVNNKLGGNVCVPTFIAERIGLDIEDCSPDVEVIHHIPEAQDKSNIKHDADLFR